jgi:hypothetical protein
MQVKDIEPIVLMDLAAQPGPRHATNGIKFHSARAPTFQADQKRRQ